MKIELPPLKLRTYAGREHGLMIIGSPELLSKLGTQLLAGSASTPIDATGWPPEIARFRTEGPYSDVREFTLSFHMEPPGGIPASLGMGRRSLSPVALSALGALALVGVVAILRWAAGHAL